ncbi:MAG: hypothetical protein A4E59_02408 [Syntrophorhabdus sp. PtaB.Bin027]|jgi:hypothetical protein|nr:hypothetical protein [Pseudomonadota bacterium]OPX93898.1 MAG: hypothetical protein A4E59_02408 [Syntrophorhabdus sp. PtaB.Bin027]
MVASIWNIKSELNYYSTMIQCREIPPKADLLARTWLQTCREIEEPEHVFIMDVREDGSLGCEDLWVFSKHYAMRVKNFIENEEVEIFGITKPISYMKLKASDYDFKDFDARSKLSLTVQINPGCEVTIKASQGNCPILETIIKYLCTTNNY